MAPREQLLAWNELQISLPATWEPRVAGLCHLIFEKDFQPRLQLRWQKNDYVAGAVLERITQELEDAQGSIHSAGQLAPEWLQVSEKFCARIRRDKASGALTGGVLYCRECFTIIHFQVFPDNDPSYREVMRCLATLSCHAEESLWRIDNFSLVTPPFFTLTDYTFAAGLTRLAFTDGDCSLQTCKLSPADIRLEEQNLTQILQTLTDIENLTLHETAGCLEGSRIPGFVGKLLLRLRRKKPYVAANIRHDKSSNRLLALILSGNRPIPGTLLHTVSNRYEIV
jgi:hypothetical protein